MESTMEKPRAKTRKKRDKQKVNSTNANDNASENAGGSFSVGDNAVIAMSDEAGANIADSQISSDANDLQDFEEIVNDMSTPLLSKISEVTEKTSELSLTCQRTEEEVGVVAPSVDKMAEEPLAAAILPSESRETPSKASKNEATQYVMQQTTRTKRKKEMTFRELNHQFEKDKRQMLRQLEEAEKAHEQENCAQMRAFTESQLGALYGNGELKTLESFVADFVAAELKGAALKQHPLYDLLIAYLQARKNVKMTAHEVDELRQSCEALQKELWNVENMVVRKSGVCSDDTTVYASYTYNFATFNLNVFKRVNRDKNKIQEAISQNHAFYSYMMQVTKLQIDSFIQKVITSVISVTHLRPNADVCLLMQNLPAQVQPFIGDLRLCVSILFQFQRKFICDPEFVKEARAWLDQLVAVLLRVSTWQDHLFLLNHILRCPPGVASWAAHYIQTPIEEKCDSPFANYEVNHVLTVLGNILLPIAKREHFLEELSQQPDVVEALWVVIDSDGEEDDETAGTALKENDLVSMLNQLPLEKFFRKVLRFDDRNVDGVLTQNHVLQLFSFLTVFLKILQNGLTTYNQARYLQLCKRLSRFIRHVVQYATDQLEIFFASSEARFSTMLERLQVEYDALFLRAFYYLYVSEKLGAWQFLAVLPFDAITSATLWKIFYFLHDFDNTTNSLLESTDSFDYRSKIWAPSFRLPFEEHLSNMAEDECYYLLSTIANMALNRKPDELEFVKCATLDILHIGFVSESTQESCSKNSRILLTHITSKYPCLLSDVFKTVHENVTSIGKLALYLYEELPISVWKIADEDLACIDHWLLHKGLTTNESKLARMIISRLNWDLDNSDHTDNSGEQRLFLPYEVHCKMASLIVRATEVDPSYLNWAWQTAVRLRLHMTDKGVKSFDQVRDIEYYVVIDKGVREQQPLAAFLSVLISSWGHLIPLICTKGFEQLLFLQLHQKHEAVLFALNLIVPLFLNCQENVINHDRFQMVLMGLLNADRTYINMAKSLVVCQNTILEQFGNMIVAQIANYKLYGLETPRCVVRLWIDSLVSVTNWNRDHGVMYLLDVVIQSAFFYKDSMDVIYSTLRDLLQASTPQETSNTLTSLFKWAAAGSNQGNLLINTSLSSYPYLAVVMIDLEHEEREKSTNLWNEILCQLYVQKGKINVDAAIKKAASKLKLPAFASGSLCIFRWAQQALDTPIDHPIAVLFWQKFFCLYLHHVRVPPNQTVCVGERFFEGVINFNFLKRMKKKLQETVGYYNEQTTDADFKDLDAKTQLYLIATQKVFNAYGLWLEEPRLQEPTLYVPGLPPQYEPPLLNMVFQCNTELWMEYVNYGAIQESHASSIRTWTQANYREKKNINRPCSVAVPLDAEDPWKRIGHRLKSYDTPKPASDVVLKDPLLPALDINDTKTLSRVVGDQLDKLTACAHNFYIESSTHTAMNREYENLIIKLYISKSTTKVLTAYCTKNNSVQCSGPAVISINAIESKINETVASRVDEFNAGYDTFLAGRLQAAPVNLCYSSVFLQRIISLLENQKLCKHESNQYGVELFYHILSLINEETSNFYPTKKLFTECLERLGQSHIHGEEEETPKLLDRILQDPNMGTYLAPHFSPVHVGTANFIMMYSMISKGLRENSDLLYSLLSKFDANKWLQRNSPKLSQRSQFIELVIKALVEMGPEPKVEKHPLHELYRKHLVSVFQYQFPEHYGEILMHILRGSTGAVSDCITVSVWLDILSTLAHPQQITLTTHVRDQLRHYAQNQNLLCYQVLMDTTRMLAQHYTAERLQYGLYGLYPKTSNYVEVISVFLGMTGHSFVISALNTHQGVLGEKVCEIIWPFLRDMFAPWIVPYWANNIKDMATWIQQLTDDRAVILPWIPANAPYAQKMVNMFFECILFIIQTLPACNNIMSFFWNWYVTNFAHPAVKDHVLNVIHHAFVSLPWAKFWPSVQDVELMLKVAEQYLPEAHTFLGHIFVEVQWHSWILNLQSAAQPPVKARIHHCLLSLIIKLCNEPNVRRNCAGKAINLLNQAEHFEWHLLEAQSVHQAMDWYIMSCDPIVILKTDPANLDVKVLNFVSIVCCYNQPYEGADVNVLIKRHIYLKTFVKLMSVFISKHKNVIHNKEKDLVSLFAAQLTHLESVVRTQQEMNVLLGELLVVANQNGVKDGVLKYFVQWLSDKEGNGMIVKAVLQSCGNYICDIGAVGMLYETAITTYFIKNVNDLASVSWKAIAGELKPYVSKYSSLVSSVIENGQFLTLHALLLDKMANSADKPALLNLCLTWFNDIRANDSNEYKIPLLWSDFLAIVAGHVEQDEPTSGQFLHRFAQHLQQLSEQKENAKWGGILGAIGIGKQAPDNLNFRFVCRALAGYLLSQLPEAKGNPQRIRNSAGAQCAVGQPGGNTEASKILLKMDFGQNQGKIKEYAEKALKQIQDPQNSFHNVNAFLRNLLLVFYMKPYLKEI